MRGFDCLRFLRPKTWVMGCGEILPDIFHTIPKAEVSTRSTAFTLTATIPFLVESSEGTEARF